MKYKRYIILFLIIIVTLLTIFVISYPKEDKCPDYRVAVVLRLDDLYGNRTWLFDTGNRTWLPGIESNKFEMGMVEFIYGFYLNHPKVKITAGIVEPHLMIRELIPNSLGNVSPWSNGLYKYLDEVGWEAACHTKTHRPLTNLTDEEIYDEVCNFKKEVEKEVNQKIITLVYPSGDFDERVINIAKKCGYKIGLVGDSPTTTVIPENKFEWGWTISEPCEYTLKELNDNFDLLYEANNKSILYYYSHVQNTNQYFNSTWHNHLSYIENKEGVWFTTHRELYKRCS